MGPITVKLIELTYLGLAMLALAIMVYSLIVDSAVLVAFSALPAGILISQYFHTRRYRLGNIS